MLCSSSPISFTFSAVSRTVRLLVSLSETTIGCGRPTEAGNAAPIRALILSGSELAMKKSAHDELLVLWPARLVGDQDRSAIKFLKEQILLQEDVIQGPGCGDIAQADFNRTRLRKRLPVEHDVQVQVRRQILDDRLQIDAIEIDHARWLPAWSEDPVPVREPAPSGMACHRSTRRRFSDCHRLFPRAYFPLNLFQSQHALHL